MPDSASNPSDGDRGDGRDSVVDFPGGHQDASAPENNNLPFQLTSLVGCEREIIEVERLLVEYRLLTLTGPGGSGKTRLALAVASDLSEEYEDGTWLVELASLSDPDLVPQTVASILDVKERPGRSLTDSLSNYLGAKKMLLVLDSCEHLIEACTQLTRTLLGSCPNLWILATSREALGITGEVSWPVPPLSLPDTHHLPAVESLPRYEAAHLFIERAQAVDPSFELIPENAMAVARVCYRLDGIPLAIELAAAGDRLVSSHALHHLAWASRLRGDHERAAMLYVEGLGVAVELGDRAGVAYCLEGMADLIAMGDQPERKARLYGASEAILETVGTPLYVQMQDRDAYNRAVEELRSRLGGEACEAAWAEGREMNPEQAIEYALERPVKPGPHRLTQRDSAPARSRF